ncbi:FAD-dependent oxidoreductase [Loigolactobacillus zhaoyuanensis]|uniref:FAD-dependent oxidoreductase n=1 Tax=Loigolactobacillus zhaoyuanensis TaxID=2486017 RepID=A0ABW8UET1_9LACO
MKVAIIGCTHAGTFATQQILAEHPTWQVTVYERNDNLSFLSCGIALWIGNQVSKPDKMFYSNPDELTKLGANMRMQHDVLNIDAQAKTLTVQNLVSNTISDETFDKLVITTGSAPIVPPLPGIDGPRVKLCKNWTHAKTLKESAPDINSAIVIGAGYIGAELAEAYAITDKRVTLIDALPHVLAKNFDKNISERIEQDYQDHGVELALNEKVTSFVDDGQQVTVTTDKGTYTADIAILCIGFRPNTSLLKNQLDMLPNGAIITDDYMQTSIPDVYAAGDSATVHYNPTQKNDYIPLATNAVRQGILVGRNISHPTEKYLGTQASSAVELFGKTYAGSGLTMAGAAAHNIKVASISIEQDYRPDFMPTTIPVLVNLTWDPTSRRVLGGSLMSKYDVAQSANVLSMAIQAQFTIDQLSMVDMFFQPNYNQPLNYINAVAMAAVTQANTNK